MTSHDTSFQTKRVRMKEAEMLVEAEIHVDAAYEEAGIQNEAGVNEESEVEESEIEGEAGFEVQEAGKEEEGIEEEGIEVQEAGIEVQEAGIELQRKNLRTEEESEMDVDSEEAAERENESFKHIRDKAAKGQSKAAAKMAHRGKQLLKPLVVGQCATLRVPNVDRGPSDPKNLIVVVLEENDGLYN